MEISKEKYERMIQDLDDMHNACQTSFTRCDCGRLREPGIICPTVQEGGACDAGS